MTAYYLSLAKAALHQLCVTIPSRRVGSPGNQQATSWLASEMQQRGFSVETPGFDCIDWISTGASLQVGGEIFKVSSSPYSLGCQVEAPLVAASSLDALAALDIGGKLLLIHGELAKEQLMPRDYPFYYPEEHKRLHQMLDQKAPLAILTATGRNPSLAGGVYPFPMIEDGNFDIPSVYLTDVEGQRLVAYAGQIASLTSQAERIPSTGCNVVARKTGSSGRRVVLTAHIDAKSGSPGALDDGTGIVTLLLLADMLQDANLRHTIEIVAINGEDYYSAPGERLYLQQNQAVMQEILLNINLDGLGYHIGRTAYSQYECPADLSLSIRQAFSAHPMQVEGEPWPQGDHMIFVMSGVPALAITCDAFIQICTDITHTAKDAPDQVEPARLVETALALCDFLINL